MNDTMKAALIGGAAAGVLTVITSMIPIVGLCCFLWAIGGGVLAVFVYLRGAGGPMTPGDGAKLGLRAGIIAAIIYLVIWLPMMLLMGGSAINSAMQQQGGEAVGAGLAAGIGLGAVFIAAAVLVGFATLGGVIGAAIFGKGAGAAPPPPPPPAAGGFGGGYGEPPAGGGFGNPPGGGGYGGPTGGSYGQGT